MNDAYVASVFEGEFDAVLVKVWAGDSASVRLTPNGMRSQLYSTGGDELFLPFVHAAALSFLN